MFGPRMHVLEAPLLGAAIGGLIGSSGAVAGLSVLGGMALGAVGGTLLGKMSGPKMPKAPRDQTAAAAAATPALPPATEMPPAPLTPVAKPISSVADAVPPTSEDIAAGQLQTEKKRKGRLSTILSTPKSRLEGEMEEDIFERLGG